ncbi:MAG: TRAP transporter substrate-binding protein DctP [Proteobacteria bacterium]|nr:TRAP transporter substrate-binding protein DctP [Pseudomonadota bacterium]
MDYVQKVLGPILFILVVLSGSLPLKAKTVLKMNHQFPANTSGSKLDQWFADQVFKLTDGELEIRIYWSNALGDAKENLVLLKNNAIDLAAVSAGYFPEELPLHSAPNAIPMGMDNVCQSRKIMEAFLKQIPDFREEAQRNGIRSLYFHLLNPYLLVSKNPVRTFAELNGMKIRTWGKDMPRLVNAAKAKSITMFLPHIYDGFKFGLIDGCPFSTDLMVSYRIYEFAKHVTEVVMWEGPGWGVWISEKTWQKTSDRHRQALISVAELARAKSFENTKEADRQARIFLKQQGVTFHPFPDSELKKWQDANPDFFNDMQKQFNQTGLQDPGRKMIGLWKKLRSEVECP